MSGSRISGTVNKGDFVILLYNIYSAFLYWLEVLLMLYLLCPNQIILVGSTINQ